MDLFSHAPEPVSVPSSERTSSAERFAVYVQTELPLAELWAAFTEYAHLWWPRSLKHDEEAHIEFGEAYFLEEEDDATQHVLGETVFFVPGDVLAIRTSAETFTWGFESGISFVFDEDGAGSVVDLCSGVVRPRDIEDAELGVLLSDLDTARSILGGFARFMQVELMIVDDS